MLKSRLLDGSSDDLVRMRYVDCHAGRKTVANREATHSECEMEDQLVGPVKRIANRVPPGDDHDRFFLPVVRRVRSPYTPYTIRALRVGGWRPLMFRLGHVVKLCTLQRQNSFFVIFKNLFSLAGSVF